MTTVAVNFGSEDLEEVVPRFISRAMTALGPFDMALNGATGDATLTWPQTLTAGQVQAVQDGARAARTSLTPNERNGIQSDIDLLVAFQGIATPTLAQTAAATKAQSRILRAILRS